MKKFLKNSKCCIAAILTLCILLGSTGFGVQVTAMTAETTATVEETAVATEEITPELVPVMARGCSNYDYDSYMMNQLKIEKGWTLRMDGDADHYIIYSGGNAVGKYHIGQTTDKILTFIFMHIQVYIIY